MCGPENSILGIEPSCVIEKLRMHIPTRFIVSENEIKAHGAIITIDRDKNTAQKIERITF